MFPTRALLLLSLAPLGCAVQAKSLASPSGTLAEVVKAETGRDAENPALPRALGAQQPMLRVAALRALARTVAPGSAPLAAPLVGDPDKTVATWAAYALGQVGGPEAEAALIDAAAGASPVPEEALLALGRTGSATAARALGARLDDAAPGIRAQAATALGLLARRLPRQFPSERYVGTLTKLLKDPERDVRFGAAYALFRFQSSAAGLALISALTDADGEIRATAVRGIGAAGMSPAVLDTILDDPDWRVRAQAARALGLVGSSTKAHRPSAAQRLVALLPRELARWSSPDEARAIGSVHVLAELVEAARLFGEDGDRVLSDLADGLSSGGKRPPPERNRIDCALAMALDAREGLPRRVKTCGDTSLPAWRRFELEARLWKDKGDQGIDPLLELSRHADERARAAAVDALGQVELDRARGALVGLLDAEDPFLVSAAAAGLAPSIAKGTRPQGLEEALDRAVRRLSRVEDPGLVAGVIDALGSFGAEGARFLGLLDELLKDRRPAVRRRAAAAIGAITKKTPSFGGSGDGTVYATDPKLSGRLHAVIETTRGPVEIVLFADVAPRTVEAFLALAAAGFYRDRSFHRVVADFVIQGGCPRGDGWGGPGRALLEETSPLPFVRGALGIATAGPDTGGSQFFIMHSRHPHLDGGYTLFGQVVSGMSVVDAIEQDDRIIDIRPEDGPKAKSEVP